MPLVCHYPIGVILTARSVGLVATSKDLSMSLKYSNQIRRMQVVGFSPSFELPEIVGGVIFLALIDCVLLKFMS